MNTMLIDCVGCAAKGPACDDCVVSALLGAPALADDERAALDVMAEGGLLPPLRLVPITAHRWRRGA